MFLLSSGFDSRNGFYKSCANTAGRNFRQYFQGHLQNRFVFNRLNINNKVFLRSPLKPPYGKMKNGRKGSREKVASESLS